MVKKTINDEGPLFQEMKAQKHRTLQFIEEVKTRGGFKKLYHAEHTNKIINQQSISLDNFYKLFERMVDGAGLFGNPVLLSAVLKDMAYPADCLFQDDNIPQSSTTLKLGPGVANELKNIMSLAFQEISKKPLRQAGFIKRLCGANCILLKAKQLREKNKHSEAINYFFYQYSFWDHKLYPHSRTKDIGIIDRLCKHCMEHNSVDSGSLLTLAYLLYEIKRISNSLVYFTGRCLRLPEAQKPSIEGFIFKDNLSTTDVLRHLELIQKSFEEVVNKFFDMDYQTITYNDGSVIQMDISFSLTNTNIIECLKYAEDCLDKIISFEVTTGVESSSGLRRIDFQFDKMVGLAPKISHHFKVIFDSSLNDNFKTLSAYLANFYESSFEM